MKIEAELTTDQQNRIYASSIAKELSEIVFNKDTGSYSTNHIEYATEDEAYEALLEDANEIDIDR